MALTRPFGFIGYINLLYLLIGFYKCTTSIRTPLRPLVYRLSGWSKENINNKSTAGHSAGLTYSRAIGISKVFLTNFSHSLSLRPA